MPTTNPKVSAYIPQHIFDRFQSFYKDKNISMSQAVAVIFAEYFEIEPEVNYSGGLLTDRIRDLELKLSELSNSRSSPVEFSKEGISELKSELFDALLKEAKINASEVQKTLFDRLESELKSSLLKELESRLLISSSSELSLMPNQLGLGLTESPILQPVNTSSKHDVKQVVVEKSPKKVDYPNGVDILTSAQLGERINSNPQLISKQKGRCKGNPEKFVAWARKKDPQGYGWKYKEESVLFYRVEPLA
jgi:hypothetical protein